MGTSDICRGKIIKINRTTLTELLKTFYIAKTTSYVMKYTSAATNFTIIGKYNAITKKYFDTTRFHLRISEVHENPILLI